MRPFDSRLLLVNALLMMFLAAASAHAERAEQRHATQVVVQNTAGDPVPVTGNVGISGNSSASPLFVDTASSYRNGFNASCATSNVDATYGQASCTLLTIPAGRQVVIETISCQAEVTPAGGPADVQLIVPNTPLGGGQTVNVSHLLTLTKQAGDAALEIWRATIPLRAYAAAPASGSVGIGLFFRSAYSPTQPVDIACTISGYLAGQ